MNVQYKMSNKGSYDPIAIGWKNKKKAAFAVPHPPIYKMSDEAKTYKVATVTQKQTLN